MAKRKQRKRTQKRRTFVGLGDPVYDWKAFKNGTSEGAELADSRGLALWRSAVRSDSETREGRALGLDRLPGTARELEEIAQLFGQKAQIYLRADANEKRIKQGALSGYRMIHIASHGLMAPHYQALALTMNPTSSEDGFLMSSEIAALELEADLVVLSACRTGNTRSRAAEPVAGMALSLRSAGVRNVVLSLWDVDDEATAALMVKFYRPLAKSGKGYVQSLARAKRAMLEDDYEHPYYWAPFVLHGPP